MKLSKKLLSVLSQLELNEKESLIYSTLLEMGPSSIQEISRRTAVNRVTTYESVGRLKNKGLLFATKRGKREFVAAESPEILQSLLREKEERLKNVSLDLQNIVLPTLRAIDLKQEKRPQVRFFEGIEGIFRVYDEYLLKYPSAMSFGSYDPIMKISTEKTESKYFSAISKRRILYRTILEDTETNRAFAEKGRGITHAKFLASGSKISADILIFGPCVATISYEKMTATVIEDDSIAKSLKMLFEFMWDGLK